MCGGGGGGGVRGWGVGIHHFVIGVILNFEYLILTVLSYAIMSYVMSALAHCKPIIMAAGILDVVKCLAAPKPLPRSSYHLPPLVHGTPSISPSI